MLYELFIIIDFLIDLKMDRGVTIVFGLGLNLYLC